MPANPDNDDILTRVQLQAAGLLAADRYFTPDGGRMIPVVSEVKEDVASAIQQRNPAGLICIVGLDSMPLGNRGGGILNVEEGRLIVRVRETIALNRGSSGTGENAVRVAQKAGLILDGKVAAVSSITGAAFPGCRFTFLDIRPALPDDLPSVETRGVVAWHTIIKFTGPMLDFDRRNAAPAAGSP